MNHPFSLRVFLVPGFLALGLLASSLLAGCAGAPLDRRSGGKAEPLPRPRSEAASPPAGVAGAAGTTEPPPSGAGPGPSRGREPPRAEAPTGGPAVVALLDTAGQRSRAGRPEEAAAALERALRIEPANPELWARLAEVRLEQGQPRQAEPLALKALDLAEPADRELRARCHRLVARARRALGDEAGAREAESRALAAEGR